MKTHERKYQPRTERFVVFKNFEKTLFFDVVYVTISLCLLDGQLKPKSVDFFRRKNRQAHKTSDYEIQNLIIRRGQQFDISITFDRAFSCQDDELVLKFVTGNSHLFIAWKLKTLVLLAMKINKQFYVIVLFYLFSWFERPPPWLNS